MIKKKNAPVLLGSGKESSRAVLRRSKERLCWCSLMKRIMSGPFSIGILFPLSPSTLVVLFRITAPLSFSEKGGKR